jgi:hypothetical protein
MGETTERAPQEGSPGQPEPGPFRVLCPQCAADSDSPDILFTIRTFATAPHTDFVLAEIGCGACGTDFDVGLWPRPVLEEEGPLVEPPDAAGLRGRYLRMVEDYRRQWEAFYQEDPPAGEIDFSADFLEPREDRLTTLPVRALAAARGLRKAVAAHPGSLPVGFLRIGWYNCVMSLDEDRSGPLPYELCLSVNHGLAAPVILPQIELRFLSSIFFLPDEWAFLTCSPGSMTPVTFFRVGLSSPEEATEC